MGVLVSALLLWVLEQTPVQPNDLQIRSEIYDKYEVTWYSVAAGGERYFLSDTIYLPHGDHKTYTFWKEDVRRYPGVNVENMLVNGVY